MIFKKHQKRQKKQAITKISSNSHVDPQPSSSSDKPIINYRKMFFEVIISLTVIFIALLYVLYPILKEKGAFDKANQYEQFKGILDEVDNYDYSKGRNRELEQKLDKGFADAFSDLKAYFYELARGTYYCHIGYFNTAKDAFEYLALYQLSDEKERLDYEARKVVCERKEAEAKNAQ